AGWPGPVVDREGPVRAGHGGKWEGHAGCRLRRVRRAGAGARGAGAYFGTGQPARPRRRRRGKAGAGSEGAGAGNRQGRAARIAVAQAGDGAAGRRSNGRDGPSAGAAGQEEETAGVAWRSRFLMRRNGTSVLLCTLLVGCVTPTFAATSSEVEQ